ncbi:MAG: choice-of-anchor D domain-containing protein [Bradymonadia bacterium]
MRTHTLYPILLLALTACDDSGDSSGGDPSTPDAMVSVDASVDEPDAFPETPPRIIINPAALQLKAYPGEPSEPGVLIVSNGGTLDLLIESIELRGDPGFSFSGFEGPGVIPTSGENRVEVVWQGDAPATGSLVFTSNDPAVPEQVVALEGSPIEICARAQPPSIDIGEVAPGVDSSRFEASLSNCGDAPFTLTDVSIEGDSGFQWAPRVNVDPVGAPIDAGNIVRLDVWYVNDALPPGETAIGTLTMQTDLPDTPNFEIPLSARGSAPSGCLLQGNPDRLDFGQQRLGTTETLTTEITNLGSDTCIFRNVAVDSGAYSTPDEAMPPPLGPGQSTTLEVSFAPEMANPQGERGALLVDTVGETDGQNRRLTLALFGIGAPATFGAMPTEVSLGEVTAGECASWIRTGRVENVGFVPLCIGPDFRLEGPDCDQFVLLEDPAFEGMCRPAERGDGVNFRFRAQPDAVGEINCTLIVDSDAQVTAGMPGGELSIPLVAEGVAEAATVDAFNIERLNDNLDASFSLSRPAVEESIVATAEGEELQGWQFNADANIIVFPRGMHPPEQSTLRVEYDAVCYPRQ